MLGAVFLGLLSETLLLSLGLVLIAVVLLLPAGIAGVLGRRRT